MENNFTKEQKDILETDKGLSADQLDDKYNPEGDGEHPVFSREQWREGVANQDTISGYWVWAAYQIAIFTAPA